MAEAEGEANVRVNSEEEENAAGPRRTFVRVKRRLKDEPPSALILSFKRQRVEIVEKVNGESSDSFEVVNNVLRFAGSIQPDQTIGSFVKGLDTSTLASSGAEKTCESLRLKSAPVSNSARRQRIQEETKKKASSCRYKIVNTKRGLDDPGSSKSEIEDEDEKYLYSMFELVEDELQGKAETKHSVASAIQDDVITCNGVPMVQTKSPVGKSTSGSDFVYDVYTIEKPLDVQDQHVDVEHLWESSQIVYDQEESDEEKYDNESDSNDENHPDNDYPDERSDASDGEKYFGFDNDDLYKWSEDEEAYGDSDDESGGSRAMKELAKHMRQVGLGARTESESSN